MHINKIELHNFKQYRDVSVDMPDGLIGICGSNGVGKSNLMMGLAWLLYGNDVFNESKDLIKYKLAAPGDDVYGSLEFTLDGREYCIQRRMFGKNLSVTAQIGCDGVVVAQKTDAVTDYVTTLLGMDWRTFYVSIYCRQKEINALGAFEPSQRRTMILQMLGIDKLDAVVSNIRQQIKACDRELLRFKVDKDINIAQVEANISAYQEASRAWEKHISELNNQVQFHTSSMQQYSEYPAEYYAAKKEVTDTTTLIESVSVDHVNIGRDMTAASTLINQDNTLINNIKRLGKNGKCGTCSNTLGDNYESALQDATVSVMEHQRQYDKLYENYKALQIQINNLHVSRSEKESKCEEILSKSRQALIAINNELRRLHEKVREASMNKSTVDQTLNTMIQTRNEYGNIKSVSEQKQALLKVEEAMVRFRAHVIGQISPILSHYASLTINQITSGKYNSINIDDNYNIIITDDNGIDHSIKHYSGGEADLFNLALRLAISRVIIDRSGSHIKFMCLDEVLSALDINNMMAVIGMLNNCVLDMGQIFIVTHQGDILNMLDSKIDIVDRGGESCIIINQA